MLFETHRGVVHPWMCDAQGHLSSRFISTMFDEASYHLFPAAGLHEVGDPRLRWVDVELTTSFRAEAHVGQLLLIRSGIERIGGKSYTAIQQLINLTLDRPVASQRAIYVRFDPDTRASVPIEDALRQAMESVLIERSADDNRS